MSLCKGGGDGSLKGRMHHFCALNTRNAHMDNICMGFLQHSQKATIMGWGNCHLNSISGVPKADPENKESIWASQTIGDVSHRSEPVIKNVYDNTEGPILWASSLAECAECCKTCCVNV